jgi:hypothetical protein
MAEAGIGKSCRHHPAFKGITMEALSFPIGDNDETIDLVAVSSASRGVNDTTMDMDMKFDTIVECD